MIKLLCIRVMVLPSSAKAKENLDLLSRTHIMVDCNKEKASTVNPRQGGTISPAMLEYRLKEKQLLLYPCLQ